MFYLYLFHILLAYHLDKAHFSEKNIDSESHDKTPDPEVAHKEQRIFYCPFKVNHQLLYPYLFGCSFLFLKY